MTDIREIVRTRATPKKDDIGEVKKVASNIDTVNQTVETAKQLAGTSKYEDTIVKQADEVKEERTRGNELQNKLHTEQIENLKENINARLDNLKADQPKGVVDTIKEIKEAAGEIGLAGAKAASTADDQIAQLQRTYELIQLINPARSISSQLQEFTAIQEFVKPKSEEPTVTMSDQTAIVLQKMKMEHEVMIEDRKDDRQDRQQKFDLMIRKFEDDKTFRNAELVAKTRAERERNAILTGGIDKVAKVVARATMEEAEPAVREQPRGEQAQAREAPPKQVPTVEAGIGESGSFSCACGEEVIIAADAESAVCANPECGQVYRVKRAKTTELE